MVIEMKHKQSDDMQSTLGIGLTIIGIILEVSAIYLTSMTITSRDKYYNCLLI